MVSLRYLIISILLVVGCHAVSDVEERKKQKTKNKIIKWSVKLTMIGVDAITGNYLKLMMDLSDGIINIIGEFEEDKVRDEINEIVKELGELQSSLTNTKKVVIHDLIQLLEESSDERTSSVSMAENIRDIDYYFNQLIKFRQNKHKYNNNTLETFSHKILYDINIQTMLDHVHMYFRSSGYQNKYSLLDLVIKDKKGACGDKQSIQLKIYSILRLIVITECKASMLVEAAIRISRRLDAAKLVGYTSAMENAPFAGYENWHDLSVLRVNDTINIVKRAMKTASREVWSCNRRRSNPSEVSHFELNNFIQKYLINEVHLNPSKHCRDSWIESRIEEHKCAKSENPESTCWIQDQCPGILTNCDFFEAKSICFPMDRSSNRRYDYLRDTNDAISGIKSENCYEFTTNGTFSEYYLEKHGFWNSFLISHHQVSHCEYRLCTCDSVNSENSDRFVNLVPVVADEDYVVTGLRLNLIDHVLTIQIKQGKILEGGRIDSNIPKYPKWISKYPEDTFKIESSSIAEDTKYNLKFITKGAINLDDIDITKDPKWARGDSEAKLSHVVTGVRIAPNDVVESGVHLNLVLRMTPYNFETGKLDNKKSFWYPRENFTNVTAETLEDRHEIQLKDLNVPTYSSEQPTPSSNHRSFFKFTTSSVKTDAGQSTIPFIEFADVETSPPVPLTGAGFYLKSSTGTGGYLAMKLFTFNFEPFIEPKEVENSMAFQ